MEEEFEKADWRGEYSAVDDAHSFRQGDLVKFRKSESPWKTWGVIITADCDIDKKKHRGIMSYVPILELHDYWRLFTLPKQLQKAETGFFKQVIPSVQSAIRKNDKSISVGPEAIHAMIMGGSDAAILKFLNAEAVEEEKWKRILSIYRNLIERQESIPIENLIKLIADSKTAVSGTPADNIAVLRDIEKSVESLPGDVFFISRLPYEESKGFVAYLRLVRELHADSIAVVAKDLRREEVIAKRIGRLESPFLYRLTQQLGQVFSDIGLPADYENDRLNIAGGVKESLIAKFQ